MQKPGGRFANRQHWSACTGVPAKEIKQLLDADLLHEAPALCSDCEHDIGALPSGTILVHGWHEFQVDPSSERVRRYREREQLKRNEGVTERVTATPAVTQLSRGTQTRTLTRTQTRHGQDKSKTLVYNPLMRGGDVVRVGDLLQNMGEYEHGDKKASD
jgi:hypothetical protein